jgi:hypothetical protein
MINAYPLAGADFLFSIFSFLFSIFSFLFSIFYFLVGVQINPNREQLRTEEADGGGIAGAARQLIREPSLAFAWIIVGKQVGCPGVPASTQPFAQLQAHLRITHNIANVSSFLAVLCHNPKLPSHQSVAHGGAARLSGLAARRFQEPISRRD